jgi:hypothetical protein
LAMNSFPLFSTRVSIQFKQETAGFPPHRRK